MLRLKMKKKGEIIMSETGMLIIAVMIIVIGVMVWVGAKGQGPLHWINSLTPKIDNPAVVVPNTMQGLVKYDFVNSKVQYYNGVEFQDPGKTADGIGVFFVNGKALKYDDLLADFKSYYFSPSSRNIGKGIILTGQPVTDLLEEWQLKLGSTEIRVVAKQMCDDECVKNYPNTQLGDVLVNVFGNSYILSVNTENNKILMQKFPDLQRTDIWYYLPFTNKNLYKAGNEVGNGKSYSEAIISYAKDWALSVADNPVNIRVYETDGGKVVQNKCAIYSVPVVKIASLSGNGFDLNADLSKAEYIGVCK